MPRHKSQASDPDGLTPLQRRFVDEYLIDLNATAAYKRAGYKGAEKGKRIDARASEILRNPRVQAAIAKKQAREREKYAITRERILHELALIAFSDLGDVAEWGTQPDGGNYLRLRPSSALGDLRRTIRSVKHTRKTGKTDEDSLEIQREDKLKALELLSRHLGLLGREGPEGDSSPLERLVQSIEALRQSKPDE